MSTDNGIFMLNKKSNQWYQYGKENGVSDENYFIGGSSFISQNGEIFLVITQAIMPSILKK